ncbi:MAG: response regulator [Desulfovibrio sp.]|jgi:DNA-binding response OmpR family regulator|nr:response regulator [Desulfovibrio sp.]
MHDSAQPRVLLVDDEDRFRSTMIRILKYKGIEARGAANAHEALEAATQETFDAVLLDMRLGRDSGLDVLRGLRDQGVETEVIVLTGHALPDLPADLAGHGVSDYLLKPVEPDEIAARIESVIERARALQRLD